MEAEDLNVGRMTAYGSGVSFGSNGQTVMMTAELCEQTESY